MKDKPWLYRLTYLGVHVVFWSVVTAGLVAAVFYAGHWFGHV